ncbi:FapA family protein [Syntrophomonas wolfei]|uniref:FapA family protein n=1 Tax=Syntrophomonas wolfei TaxID=863 RepID=UPI0023EFAEB1|nr:FapA family protein [Syntrophomonas wolfei]
MVLRSKLKMILKSGGGIEATRVISRHGSVFVKNGIIGGGKAQVKAGKNVEARFIQEATIEAGQNIVINEYTVRSNLKAGDAVLIQGRRGIILGKNIITARTRIKASKVINCPALDLRVEGIERKQFYEQIKELNSRIDQQDTELKKIAEQIRYLRDKSSEQNSLQQLQELLPQYMDMNEELDCLYEERRSLVNMLKSTRGEGMIEIGGGLETGMTFGIKEDFIKLKQQAKNLRMYYDPDKKRIIILD